MHLLLNGLSRPEDRQKALSAEEPDKMQAFLFENYLKGHDDVDRMEQHARIFSDTDTMRQGNINQLLGEAKYAMAGFKCGIKVSQSNIDAPHSLLKKSTSAINDSLGSGIDSFSATRMSTKLPP